MVTHSPEPTRDVFDAIADPIRRAIVDQLRDQETPAGAIGVDFPVSRPAISKHLRILREARLVAEVKVGRQRIYRLQPDRLQEIDRWLGEYRQFWEKSLHNLKAKLEADIEK